MPSVVAGIIAKDSKDLPGHRLRDGRRGGPTCRHRLGTGLRILAKAGDDCGTSRLSPFVATRRPVPSSVMSSHQNRHRLQNRRDWLSIKLTHDRDPQWLDAATAGAETGGIGRRHRYGWMLLLQLFHHHIRPSAAQHALYVSLVDPFVDDQDQCRVI